MTDARIISDGAIRTKPFPVWLCFGDDEIEAVSRVLQSGKVNYWTGAEGHLFEKAFAASVGLEYIVTVMVESVSWQILENYYS